MFNHESEFRDNDYLFMKIINSAEKIKNGELDNIEAAVWILKETGPSQVMLQKQYLK